MAFDPSKYTVAKAKPLPVILLLDRSGSMSGEKITTLNSAVNEMIESFKSVGNGEVEINLGIISFGSTVEYSLPLQDVKGINAVSLVANGKTPMGTALSMAKELIEDKKIVPSKCYRPTIVLVSDGEPNDNWEAPMQKFIYEGRSSKCERFAMAIGTSQNDPVLNKFLAGTENKIFLADEAAKIRDFFRFVTMSVSVRSKSVNPSNLLPPITNSLELPSLEGIMDI